MLLKAIFHSKIVFLIEPLLQLRLRLPRGEDVRGLERRGGPARDLLDLRGNLRAQLRLLGLLSPGDEGEADARDGEEGGGDLGGRTLTTESEECSSASQLLKPGASS